MRILVTGGAGFIGSAVCRHLVTNGAERVVNVDKLTYAASLRSLGSLPDRPNYVFYQVDILHDRAILDIMRAERIDAVMHLAAESHVDRSIDAPGAFLETNVIGTFRLLNAALQYWRELSSVDQERFRFHQVSTDEVFGALPLEGGVPFHEKTLYAPSSPYSASKAASDHFAYAWYKTYGLPVVMSNCSNNYGPCQFPEKLIPLMILSALDKRPLPVYGNGGNIRDWLFVEDHARALEMVITKGAVGERYNIGGGAERTNLSVVESICDNLDARHIRTNGESFRELITFVTDRPGHDLRYAVDATKIERELGWRPRESFETGLSRTIDWYLENQWWKPAQTERSTNGRQGKARKNAA